MTSFLRLKYFLEVNECDAPDRMGQTHGQNERRKIAREIQAGGCRKPGRRVVAKTGGWCKNRSDKGSGTGRRKGEGKYQQQRAIEENNSRSHIAMFFVCDLSHL